MSQKYNKRWHSVVYFSRKLLSAKQNYNVHDKELLAIIVILKKWKIYVKKESKIIIFMNHKNLLSFIKTKKLNWWQIKWSELLEQYKFTIQYISKKNNDRADALNRRSDDMENKAEFNHSIFKMNKNGLLSANTKKLSAVIKILRNDKKTYFIINDKLQILKNRITEIIKKYDDGLFQKHVEINKTLQFLWQNCKFPDIRKQIETYIKKCFNCQQNKHETYAKYERIQYQKSSKESWKEVSMDFIMKLPKSKNETIGIIYDNILIIVDKFSKYAYFIVFKKTYNVK